MSLINIAPLPMSAPLTQVNPDGTGTDYCSSDWYQSLFAMVQRLQSSPQVITSPIVFLSGQDGSISPTALSVGAVQTGVYRIGWFSRITTAATTSSSLTVSLSWTDPDGTSLSGTGGALTTNTTTASQSGMATVRVKGDTPVNYATTYVSVGGVSMVYSLTVFAEFLGPQ